MSGRLPGFIGIGAQKAGTTTVFEWLRQHPGVFMPPEKETHFFYDDDAWADGRGLQAYSARFADAAPEQLVGEITPEYLLWESVPARIREALGAQVRLVVVLRHPVDRAWSHYRMTRSRGLEPLPFEAALAAEEERCREGTLARAHYSYAARSRYAAQLARFLACFPREQLHVMVFERDVLGDPVRGWQALCDFLGVPPVAIRQAGPANPATDVRYPALARWLWDRDRPLRRLARRALPAGVRRVAFDTLSGVSRQPAPDAPLEANTRDRILRDWFASDIRDLAGILGDNIPSLWAGAGSAG